jgi:hypothetical protein
MYTMGFDELKTRSYCKLGKIFLEGVVHWDKVTGIHTILPKLL